MDKRLFIFLFVIWAKVDASNRTTSSNWPVVLRVLENCIDKNDSLVCLQQKVLNFATRMTQSKSLQISEGFKFVQDEQVGRSMSGSISKNSGASLSNQIWNQVATFFRTHSVEVNIPKLLDTDDEARKKKGGYGGILLLAGAAKGAMIYMGMHAIAALAGKALLVAKVALTIASVIALKKLLEGSGGKTSYEIIKHPQHTYVQTHSTSHEYGGAGHGGGYEGHYRKRSITKPGINLHELSAIPAELGKSSDSWRFQSPEKDFGIRFANNFNVPNESQRTENGAQNREGVLSQQTITDGSQSESSNRNSFAVNVDGKNGLPQPGNRAASNEFVFSPLRLRRSLSTKFT